jgi:hypothetical protein
VCRSVHRFDPAAFAVDLRHGFHAFRARVVNEIGRVLVTGRPVCRFGGVAPSCGGMPDAALKSTVRAAIAGLRDRDHRG